MQDYRVILIERDSPKCTLPKGINPENCEYGQSYPSSMISDERRCLYMSVNPHFGMLLDCLAPESAKKFIHKTTLRSKKLIFLEVTEAIRCNIAHKVGEVVSVVLQEGTVIATHPEEARKLLCYYSFAFKEVSERQP